MANVCEAPGVVPGQRSGGQGAGVRIFVGLFLAVSALLAGACIAWVRFVDPYGDFGSGRFPAVVMDSRREKIRLFRRYKPEQVTGLTFGSSRAMLLEPRLLNAGFGGRFFNFAVENAYTEDFLALYRWSVGQGARPKTVIVAVDVVGLHENDIPDPMFNRIPEMKAQLEAPQVSNSLLRSGLWDAVLETHRALTYTYLKDTVKSVQMAVTRRKPTSGFDEDGYENNGTPHHPPATVADPLREITLDTALYVKRLEGMKRLSARRKEQLRQLIREARNDGAQTILWLTPVHPVLLERIASSTNYLTLVHETREYLQSLHLEYGAAIHDFTDLQRFGGTTSGWHDGTHMDVNNMTQVALTLVGRRP